MYCSSLNSANTALPIAELYNGRVIPIFEEIERDIFCIGASIVKNEQIIGAFSVSMPKYRLTDETKEQIISALKQTKSEIEQRIQK